MDISCTPIACPGSAARARRNNGSLTLDSDTLKSLDQRSLSRHYPTKFTFRHHQLTRDASRRCDLEGTLEWLFHIWSGVKLAVEEDLWPALLQETMA
eukprot:2061002-Amphidinium_carterae.1